MYCQNCGTQTECSYCPSCGRTMADPSGNAADSQQPGQTPAIIINNSNQNNGSGWLVGARKKDKWVALVLCIFLGLVGGHKFYEEKIGLGILYLLTAGLFGIGWIVDIIIICGNPNPYFV